MENNNLQQWAQKTALEKAPSLINELEAASEHLGNLLAVIHGDGGHYQDEHGTAKAVADAEAKVVQWLASDDAKAAAYTELFAAADEALTLVMRKRGPRLPRLFNAVRAIAAIKGQK